MYSFRHINCHPLLDNRTVLSRLWFVHLEYDCSLYGCPNTSGIAFFADSSRGAKLGDGTGYWIDTSIVKVQHWRF